MCFGLGMALQHRAARTIPFESALRASLVARLLQRPLWLAGAAASGVGFVLQLLALRSGSLVTVAPIILTALVVCLALTAWLDHEPLGAGRWAAIVAVVGGIALFLVASSARHAATTTVAGLPLVLATAALVALIITCVRRARGGAGVTRAIAVGAAAGLGNAYVAVLARASSDVLRDGVGAALRSPYPYGLGLASVVALLLVQAIYQAGRPTLSLPVAMTTEAAGSVVLAVAVLHEHPVLTGGQGSVAVVGLVVALVALVQLSRDQARAAEVLTATPS